MNRRGFLASLFGAAAAVTVDPEKLLWVPGKKLISVPPVVRVPCNSLLTVEYISAELLRVLQHNLVLGNVVQRRYRRAFRSAAPKIGSTITVRRPARFASV